MQYKKYYVEIDVNEYYRTGEIVPVSAPLTEMEVGRRIGLAPKGNFSITRDERLCGMLDCIGGVKGKIMSYLVGRRDSENEVLYIAKNLSEEIGVTPQAINRGLKELEKSGTIIRDYGKVMVDPEVIHRGNRQREGYLIKKYEGLKLRRGIVNEED